MSHSPPESTPLEVGVPPSVVPKVSPVTLSESILVPRQCGVVECGVYVVRAKYTGVETDVTRETDLSEKETTGGLFISRKFGRTRR